MGDTIFGVDTPATGDANDATNYTIGTYFSVSINANLTKVRWYAAASSPAFALLPVQWQLWNADTTALLTSGTFGTLTAGAWNEVAVSVSLTAGVNYCISIVTDRYVATSHYFDAPITHGIVTAPTTAGKFTDIHASSTPDFPTGSFGNGGYFVDVDVSASGSSVDGTVAQTVTATAAVAGAVVRSTTAAQTVTATAAVAGTVTLGQTVAQTVTAVGVVDAVVIHNATVAQTVTATGSVTPEPAAAPVAPSGWGELLSIYRQNVTDAVIFLTTPITICPNHAYPLDPGRTPGTLHCTFGGEFFDLYGNPTFIQ